MENKRIVVVGGVAGGMSFATRYRRLNQNDHIIVLEKGPYVSFANCGLPYHISGEIASREDLLVAKESMLASRFQIDVRANNEVISVDPLNKIVVVQNESGVQNVAYDTLVLSVGAKAIELEIEGSSSHQGIFTLRNIPEMDQILNYIEENKPRSAVVIGAGFIGLETAEALHKKGLKVSIIEKAPHVLGPMDFEMANVANQVLIANGIQTYTSTSVVKIDQNSAYLEDGTCLEADLMIMAVGVLPATSFVQDSGIKLGLRGGIVVDKNFKTSVDDIYAVGDAIITYNAITKEDAFVSLASPANRQGRQLADILSGISKSNTGSYNTAIVRIFDMTFAMTGLNERSVNADDVHIIHLKANHHAGYFPGASPVVLKLLFDKKSHQILGAQAYGKEGVDKRIDIIATAIRAGMDVMQLQELELSYAPPYGSAKDIINMAGYVGENLILGLTQTRQWHEVEAIKSDEAMLILDVRSVEEFEEGHIESAINMPLDTLRCSMNQLPNDKKILVYCASGIRSYNAERILRDAGFEVENLDGAYGLYASTKS